MATDMMTPEELSEARARWPAFNSPTVNADILAAISSELRSQCLYNEPFQISHADIAANLRAAQDDIATALQLLEKRLGKQLA